MLTRIYGYAFEDKEALDIHIARIEKPETRSLKLESISTSSPFPTWLDPVYRSGLRKEHFSVPCSINMSGNCVRRPATSASKFRISERPLYHERTLGQIQRRTFPYHNPGRTRIRHETDELSASCGIYARKQWSYRELPQRYANTTMCYRDEQSGELSGLARRSLTRDDAHVFCRM